MTLKPWQYEDPWTGDLQDALTYMGQPGLDIACAIPSRTQREEPIMDKTRFAETLDVQDPELQLLSAVINEEFEDVLDILRSMSPKDRAVLSFHLGQLMSMSVEVDMKAKPWAGF